MTAPHAHPPHPAPPDPLRTAANRRIFVFIAASTLLFAGALWVVLRKDKITISPTPKEPDAPALEAPATGPAPVAPAPAIITLPPSSPLMEQSRKMEEALVAFREAADHLVAKRFQPAEERALAALRAVPDMASAQRVLGLVYLQQGRIDLAISVLEASLRNEPFHPEALTNLAFAYLQAQNPGLAMELIETCRRLHPDYKPALLQQGIMLLAQPDSQEAVDVLREAVESFPALPGPRNNLAVALARQGDRAGAREQLAIVLEIDPRNFSALFNMGGLFAQETNAPAAIPWLRQAMAQMPPANFRAYLNDPDLGPIRDSAEFLQLLQEIDPAFPGQQPPR